MFNIISIIVVATLGVIGNIVYFEYRLKKEHKRKTKIKQLTKLLQPLYMILKIDELEYYAWQKNEDADLYEYWSGLPNRLLDPIKKILDNYFYLANDELQTHSLQFLQWGYSEDNNKRFQKLHTKGLKQDKALNDFRKLVYQKYNEQKNLYIK